MIFHSYVSLPEGIIWGIIIPFLVFCWMKRMYMCENKNPPDSWLTNAKMIHIFSIILHQDDPSFFVSLILWANFSSKNHIVSQSHRSTLTLTNSVWASVGPGVGSVGFVWKRLKLGGYPKWRSPWWSPWDLGLPIFGRRQIPRFFGGGGEGPLKINSAVCARIITQ